MTRRWRLRRRDGSTLGPWEGSKAAAREAALRAGGWRRLPPGSVLEDADPPRPRIDAETVARLSRPFVPRIELIREARRLRGEDA